MAGLKICVITQQLKNVFSGPGTYSNLIIQKFINDGHKVHVILPENQLPNNPNFSYQTIRNPTIKSHARWMELSFYFNAALKKSEQEFDLIHCTDIHDSFFIKTKTPLISNINDTYATKKYPLAYLKENYTDWILRFIYYSVTRLIEKNNINKNDAIIANSKYTRKVLIDNYPFINKKVHICYKTINFSQTNEDHFNKKNKTDYLILFVGGNMERKGLLTIINSAPKVIEHIPQVKYYIIGQDSKINLFKKKCKDLGIDNNFNFLGNIYPEKLKEFYQIADLFVMPSIDEALGIVFLEAMENNIAVIGSKVGGIPEIINNNENGILVEPNNPEELTDKILLLKNNIELRSKIIQNAKKNLDLFSNESMFKCTYKIYAKVLGNAIPLK